MNANIGQVVEAPKGRRTGGRGRGKATDTNAKAATARGRGKGKDDWALPLSRLSKLGEEMVNAAVNNVKDAATLWDQARTVYVEAQTHGQAAAAVAAIFAPGEAVKGRKAPWYRTYKSILNSAATLSIPVTNEMGVTALQKEIKAAKDDQQDPKAKQAQILGMVVRLCKGYLERGGTKASLAKAIAEIEV